MKAALLLLALCVCVDFTYAIDLPAIKPGCPPPTCLSHNDDILFPHAEQTLFYQCAPVGQDEFGAVVLSCPEFLWFSYEEQTCLFPVNWRGVCGEYLTTTVAPELCGEPRCETDEQILTLHPAEDPTFFYQCTYRFGDVYEPKKMPCAPGTLFGFEQQTCVYPDEWTDVCDGGLITSPVTPPTLLPGDVCPAPICDTQAEFEVLHPADNPKNYYECIGGAYTDNSEAVLRSCPPGLFFGFKQQACVQPCYWEESCNGPATQPTTTTAPITTTPVLTTTTTTSPVGKCVAPLCRMQAEVNVKHPAENPHQYFVCIFDTSLDDFAPVLYSCPHGLFFGMAQQDCVAPCYWQDACTEDPTTNSTSTSTPSSTTGTTHPTGTPLTTPIPTTTTENTASTVTVSPNSTTGTTRTTPTTTQSTTVPVGSCSEPACYTLEEINMLHPTRNPQDFYECVNQGNGWYVAVKRTCDAGLLFGYRNQRCVEACDWEDICRSEQTGGTTPVTPPTVTPPTGGNCEAPACASESERRTLHPAKDPQHFYQCNPNSFGGHDVVQMTCPSGLWFGYEQQVCVWPRDWKDACEDHSGTEPVTPEETTTTTTSPPVTPPTVTPPTGGNCEAPACNTESERRTLHPAKDPQHFYQCNPNSFGGHDAVLMTCPSGLWFGYDQQVCVWPRDWKDACEEHSGTDPVTPEETTTTTTSPPVTPPTVTPPTGGNCEAPACNTESERRTLHPAKDPQHFYQCNPNSFGGHDAVLMTCPSGLWFGYDQQVCVWPRDWKDACEEHSGTDPVTPEETSTTTTAPPSGSCIAPECNKVLNLLRLFPAHDSSNYYQCILKPSGGYEVVLRKCAFGLLFSDHLQSCVLPSLWTNACIDSTETTTIEPQTTTTESATTTLIEQTTTDDRTDSTAPDDTTTAPTPPGSGSCAPPECGHVQDLLRLYPANEPANYYQCIAKPSGGYEVVVRKCAFGLLFSKKMQSCVLPSLWTDSCSDNTETTTSEPQTTTAVTEETTTVAPVTLPAPACGETPDCTQVALRVLHPAWGSVSSFYRCEPVANGFTAVLRECVEGTWFSFWAQGCVWPADWQSACGNEINVTTDFPETTTESAEVTVTTTSAPVTLPPPSCGEAPDCNQPDLRVLHPSSLSATAFYRCHPVYDGWTAVLNECNGGTLFSFWAQGCVWSGDWQSACGNETITTTEAPETTTLSTEVTTTTSAPATLPPPTCGEAPACDQSEISVLQPATTIDSFYRCEPTDNGFVANLRLCMSGTWFSFQHQGCVWPSEFVSACDTITEPPPADMCGPPLCVEHIDRLYPHKNAQKFYRCLQLEGFPNLYEPIAEICPDGMFFGAIQQACVPTCDWVDQCNTWSTRTRVV